MEADFQYVPLTRAAAEKHAEEIAALGRDQPWENWRAENVLIELPDKWRLSILVLLGNVPVAYAIVSRKGFAAHIHHLVLGPAWRGKGIGRNMLLRIAAQCADEGTLEITLKVHRTNVAAMAFYQRSGFSLTAENLGDWLQMRATTHTVVEALACALGQEQPDAARSRQWSQ